MLTAKLPAAQNLAEVLKVLAKNIWQCGQGVAIEQIWAMSAEADEHQNGYWAWRDHPNCLECGKPASTSNLKQSGIVTTVHHTMRWVRHEKIRADRTRYCGSRVCPLRGGSVVHSRIFRESKILPNIAKFWKKLKVSTWAAATTSWAARIAAWAC